MLLGDDCFCLWRTTPHQSNLTIALGIFGQFVCTCLGKMLARWVAWVISTSGLEQGYSQLDKLYGHCRRSLSRQAEQDILTLLVDRKLNEEVGTTPLIKKNFGL